MSADAVSTDGEAIQIVDQIMAERIFEIAKIESYLESKGIRTRSDMVRIMQAMAERKAPFVGFIEGRLLDCASKTDGFFRLLMALSGWRGWELEPLQLLYERDPPTASWLIRRLECADQSASIPLGYLYIGVGRKKIGKLLDIAGKRMSPVQKTAWVTAIDIVCGKRKVPSTAEKFIIGLSRSRTPEVKRCAMYFMLGRMEESGKMQRRLFALAKNGGDEYRSGIANIPRLRTRDKKIPIKLLELCSRTRNTALRDSIVLSLSLCAPECPLECIKILKRWSKSPSFFGSRSDHLLQEIGKGGPGKIRRFMVSWIRGARNPTDVIVLPYVISHVYQNDEAELAELLEAAGYGGKRAGILVLAILKSFLNEGHGNVRRSDKFCEYAKNAVLYIAKQRGTNARPDPGLGAFMGVLDLIKQIEHPKNANIDDALNSLKRFKNISRIIGTEKLEEMVLNVHRLAVWLSDARDPKIPQGAELGKPAKRAQDCACAWLSEIDGALSQFGGSKRIKTGLANDAEFPDTLAELIVAARLGKKFPVTLQPRVGGKVLDAESVIYGSRVLFEVFRPKGDVRLRYIEAAHAMGNVILDKMAKKIDGQVKHARSAGCPVVLVIDNSEAWEIDGRDIVNSLLGTESAMVPFCEGGIAGPPRLVRAKDSIYDKTPGARVISAVLLVDMHCDETGAGIKMGGEMFRAPNPLVPLDGRVEEAVKNAILGDA